MRKEIVTTDKAPAPGGTYSQAVKLGNMVYVAGTCPFELGTGKVLYPDDIVEQTRLVLHYMNEILRAAGTSIEHVVKVTSFLRNLDDFKAYDRVYAETFCSFARYFAKNRELVCQKYGLFILNKYALWPSRFEGCLNERLSHFKHSFKQPSSV